MWRTCVQELKEAHLHIGGLREEAAAAQAERDRVRLSLTDLIASTLRQSTQVKEQRDGYGLGDGHRGRKAAVS